MTELLTSVDLGGTKIAVAGSNGEIVAEDRIATNSHEGATGVLPRIAGLGANLCSSLGVPPAAVGMGVPGLADVATGITRFLPNLLRNGAALDDLSWDRFACFRFRIVH